jgi:GntR family transcriptional regulator/MocR family aminotransferase
MSSATLEIRLDKAGRVPVYRQIVQAVADAIRDGHLVAGGRLPSGRDLAARLGINPLTVAAAYRELTRAGWAETTVGRGTFVAARPPAPPPGPATAGRAAVRPPPERPALISFRANLPAAESLPAEAIRRALDTALRRDGGEALQYPPAGGVEALRSALAAYLGRLGFRVEAEAILVTSGTSQAMLVAARALLRPGEVVVAERPSYHIALGLFEGVGARVVGVPLADDGLDLGALEAVVRRHRPRLIYTMPTFQNPTGLTLGLDKRRRLLELARRERIPILEDDHLSEIRYRGRALPPLRALDAGDGVIYMKSFSKIVAPAMRIGCLVAPAGLRAPLAEAKQAVDPFVSGLTQRALALFLRPATIDRHLARARRLYGARLEALVEALRAHMPPGVRWTEPDGGLTLWVALPDGCAAREVGERAADVGVTFLEGSHCAPDGDGPEGFRLSFGHLPEAAIREGIRRLAHAVRAALRPGVARPLPLAAAALP